MTITSAVACCNQVKPTPVTCICLACGSFVWFACLSSTLSTTAPSVDPMLLSLHCISSGLLAFKIVDDSTFLTQSSLHACVPVAHLTVLCFLPCCYALFISIVHMHCTCPYYQAFCNSWLLHCMHIAIKFDLHKPLQTTMLLLAVLAAMVVMATAILPTEEISTQATSVETALLLVTMAMVVPEEMPSVVSLGILQFWGCLGVPNYPTRQGICTFDTGQP